MFGVRVKPLVRSNEEEAEGEESGEEGEEEEGEEAGWRVGGHRGASRSEAHAVGSSMLRRPGRRCRS